MSVACDAGWAKGASDLFMKVLVEWAKEEIYYGGSERGSGKRSNYMLIGTILVYFLIAEASIQDVLMTLNICVFDAVISKEAVVLQVFVWWVLLSEAIPLKVIQSDVFIWEAWDGPALKIKGRF